MTQKPILALDIGGGTQDILLYNPLDSMEKRGQACGSLPPL